jgi:hypothetical protein
VLIACMAEQHLFSYSFCTIEISGQCLDPIFEDACIGKLGAIRTATSEEIPNGQLWVTGIVIIHPLVPHSSAFHEESFDA